MITLQVAPHNEKLAPVNPWNLADWPLYHQWRTFQALQQSEIHLVVNSYNTGSGKTQAALLQLFTLAGQEQDVLFVAPTNALLGQHAEDAHAFVHAHRLDFKVIPVTAATIQEHRKQLISRGDYTERQLRKGEVLFRLIRNYREFYPGEYRRQGLIFVVNPDIFYYAMMFRYGSYDERNLFHSFLTHFSYIVVDEFHYYDEKQLAFFLFFFAISRQMGYFERAGRKLCLLSATPNGHVIDYLQRLFGDNWRHISPENEPADSSDLPSTPALAPLTLTIDGEGLLEWGRRNRNALALQLQYEQLHGAVISDSLRRINQLYAGLRVALGASNIGRITGPEPEAARQSATGRSLILATPTVDIGYNFAKLGKERQNVDFLICEARFGDDLLQRIGRAGRVLGKPVTDQPSNAVALLNEAAVDALRQYDGRTLTRAELKALIQQHEDVLPHKHNLTGYIRSWAITEVFYPIHRAHKLAMLPEEQEALENLFELLRDLFGVRGTTFGTLSGYFYKFRRRERWLAAAKTELPLNRETAEHVADWLAFRGEDKYEPADIEPHLSALLAHPHERAALRRFVEGQVHLTRSLFSFRDSFQGPTTVVYDPDNLLSTETINSHDLFHIVEAYDVNWFTNRSEFVRLCGPTEMEGKFYGRLLRHRDPLLRLEFHLRADEPQEDFSRQWEGRPVALNGLKLVAREQGGDQVPLPLQIHEALADSHQTMLLVAPDMIGWAMRRLKHSPIYGRKLHIDFLDRQGVEYTAYVGQAAWLAHSELLVAYKIRERMKSEAIIL